MDPALRNSEPDTRYQNMYLLSTSFWSRGDSGPVIHLESWHNLELEWFLRSCLERAGWEIRTRNWQVRTECRRLRQRVLPVGVLKSDQL